MKTHHFGQIERFPITWGQLIVAFAVFVGFLASCGSGASPRELSASDTFVLASTTSTQDSGILDALIASFEAEHPEIRVKVLAVGSGEAMELGLNGDADILLVHSPSEEEDFMRKGKGVFRKPVMSNHFAIAGPTTDPIGIKQELSPGEAFRRISGSKALFVSRGDNSGTHRAEIAIWRSIDIEPGGPWYLATGQGMGETITIAAEKGAYLLTDTATFFAHGSGTGLDILLRSDHLLHNPYSVIPVKGARNLGAALSFAAWVTGANGQSMIADFGKERFGVPLFSPAAP